MEKLDIKIVLVKKVDVARQTDNMYFQALNYQHLWKENGQIENIFIIRISDQFYNPDTKKELVNSIEVHFKFFSTEKILNEFQIPEKRHKGSIPLISKLTFEALKILRTDTVKLFTKSEFKNLGLPNLTETDVYKIVMQKLPQMDKSKMPISLGKEDWVANYVITMFSIISDATSDKKIIIDGNRFIIKKKETEEIFEFTENIEGLKNKIIFDFFRNPALQYLHLTQEESDLFRKCSHAAYFFEVERNEKDPSKIRIDFIDLHNKFFKS